MNSSEVKKILPFSSNSEAINDDELYSHSSINTEQPYSKPAVVVIFGASGDLTRRKLIPAFFNLVREGYLTDKFKVIGISRTEYTDQEFRDHLYEHQDESDEESTFDRDWKSFAKNIFYKSVDVKSEEGFEKLYNKIDELFINDDEVNVTCYLSTAPSLFSVISEQLGKLMNKEQKNKKFTWKLVVEKPFGDCLESAKKLNSELRGHFSEDQIYRIDHYLGKETVLNILVMRFLNSMFEPLWNSRYIEQIQISVSEEIGVGTRASFFDKTGITKDFVQNHIMQILSLLCIEPPLSLDNPSSITDEKVKVLKSIKRYSKEEALNASVLGQYKKGNINGKEVPAYKDEDGVPKGSLTETFVALRFEIDNWRWSGVPVYVKVGKRLKKKVTEISIFFKTVPTSLLTQKLSSNITQNVLKLQVHPQEGLSLSMNSKLPGQGMAVSPVELDFSYAQSFTKDSPEAYERLLLDAIKGQSGLFIRDDETEEAWSLLKPFFEAWKEAKETKGEEAIKFYEAGSWGPEEASDVIVNKNHAWRKI